MRSTFDWYLQAYNPDYRKTFESYTLVLDTNVLLSLYKYHKETRDSLLSSIKYFAQRVWLPDQVAQEFFRNRKRTIATSKDDFSQALKGVGELRKTLTDKIRAITSNRPISPSILTKLELACENAFKEAEASIDEAAKLYPDYSADDPILEDLVSFFDGRIGQPYEGEALDSALATAQTRITSEVPPGYLDNAKENWKKAGDYLLWRQTMDFAKSQSKSIILVTSENKEDWWEKKSGLTLGPRMEMIEEFFGETGQHVIILKTEWFVHIAGEFLGAAAKDMAVQEIRDVAVADDKRQSHDFSKLRGAYIASKRFDLIGELSTLDKLIERNLRQIEGLRWMINKSPLPLGGPALEARLRMDELGERSKAEQREYYLSDIEQAKFRIEEIKALLEDFNPSDEEVLIAARGLDKLNYGDQPS